MDYINNRNDNINNFEYTNTYDHNSINNTIAI